MLMLVLWDWTGQEFLCAGWRCCLGWKWGCEVEEARLGVGRGVVVLGLGRLGAGGYSTTAIAAARAAAAAAAATEASSGSNRTRTISRARARDRHGGTAGGSSWAVRWWRWRLLWTGREMEMKGLLGGRRRGGWGRVEAVVDQGEEPWGRAKLLLSFGGALRGSVHERAGLPAMGKLGD